MQEPLPLPIPPRDAYSSGEGGRYQDHKPPDRTVLNSDDIVTSWHQPTQFQQILFTSDISADIKWVGGGGVPKDYTVSSMNFVTT